jgi:hypothetical protein
MKQKSLFQIPWNLIETVDVPQWLNPRDFLEKSFFKALCEEFPSLSYFEWHNGYARKHNQRPHNRYYAAYEESLHHPKNHVGAGVIKHQNLSENWQKFITEMQNNEEYHDFMKKFLKIPAFLPRFEFHIGITDCEVSPHLDAPAKAGKHIFYFNTFDDWQESWGGQTLMLEERMSEEMNPDFFDFRKISATKMLENYSFLQRCTPDSWHGARKLTCPARKYRKVLNVVWGHPDVGKQDLIYRANYL